MKLRHLFLSWVCKTLIRKDNCTCRMTLMFWRTSIIFSVTSSLRQLIFVTRVFLKKIPYYKWRKTHLTYIWQMVHKLKITVSIKTWLLNNLRMLLYCINTNEISGELSCENMISAHVKITCHFHLWKDHRCYGYIINCAFRSKKTFKWNGLAFHWCLYNK